MTLLLASDGEEMLIVCLCSFEYHWADGVTIKKPIKVPAQQYVDYLMTWVQGQMDDEAIFPSKQGMCFLQAQCDKER